MLLTYYPDPNLDSVKESNAKRETSKSNTDQSGTVTGTSKNTRRRASKQPGEAVPPRRSARLASKYKYTVPSTKPIFPNKWLLEEEGPRRSLNEYDPRKLDSSKEPPCPRLNPGGQRLKREYSFVCVDFGSHFEMVSPKALNHFHRVPKGLATVAPYHNFGPNLSEEELRKKLGATSSRVVKKDDNQKVTDSQKASGSQTRKRGRAEDDDKEVADAGNAGTVGRPTKKARVAKGKSTNN